MSTHGGHHTERDVLVARQDRAQAEIAELTAALRDAEIRLDPLMSGVAETADTGVRPLITALFPQWSQMLPHERNRVVLRRAEPVLAEALFSGNSRLPDSVRASALAILDDSGLLGSVNTWDDARSTMAAGMNLALAQAASNPQHLQAVLALVREPGSVGRIGELYVHYHATDPAHADSDQMQMVFARSEIPGLVGGTTFRPDRFVPLARRTLDVKAGYSDSDIELSQARNYAALIAASHTPGPVQTRLGGPLDGHDYLFLPTRGLPADAAERAHALLSREGLLPPFRVFYMGANGVIYQCNGRGQRRTEAGSDIHAAMTRS